MRKSEFCLCENKGAFVFATRIVQFQASSHLLWRHRPVCVRPGRKPRRPVNRVENVNVSNAQELVQPEPKNHHKNRERKIS